MKYIVDGEHGWVGSLVGTTVARVHAWASKARGQMTLSCDQSGVNFLHDIKIIFTFVLLTIEQIVSPK